MGTCTASAAPFTLYGHARDGSWAGEPAPSQQPVEKSLCAADSSDGGCQAGASPHRVTACAPRTVSLQWGQGLWDGESLPALFTMPLSRHGQPLLTSHLSF